MKTTNEKQLIVVSNRLPYQINHNHNGDIEVLPGSGGLVRALVPLLRQRGGVWIGWDGYIRSKQSTSAQDLSKYLPKEPFKIVAIPIDQTEYQQFYIGFANEIIWPLFHLHPSLCRFSADYWKSYLAINQRFANTIKEYASSCLIWVHDYHLMQVAAYLRKDFCSLSIGFFLHIPFPPPDLFAMLPWRKEIIAGLMAYDTLGFQSQRDVKNFIACVQYFCSDCKILQIADGYQIQLQKRMVKVNAFPISIDEQEFIQLAQSHEVIAKSQKLRRGIQNRTMIFSVERLDYTKGILNKLEGFKNTLKNYPELQNQITLILHVSPSREDIPDYYQIKTDIECLVSRINGQFTLSDWVPVHFIYHSLNIKELVAYYLAADIALITPLIDGMNLIAKEYCVSNRGDGVLILSEFAGASAQLQPHAIIINPYDMVEAADCIYHATIMSNQERRQRMQELKKIIYKNNVFAWANSFLSSMNQITACAG